MKIYRYSFLFALLCFANTHVLATEWEKIIQINEAQIYADLDSYTVINGNPSLTTKTVFKTPQRLVNQANVSYIIKIRNSVFNCKEHTVKDLTQTFYSKNNTLLLNTSSTMFKATNADSIDQQIESLTCQVHKMVGGL